MSKKILPISYPMITSWQWHATLFSIIGDDEKAKNWIFSNYIQLRCYNIEEIFTGDEMLLADMMPGSSSLKECPYLLFSLMTKEQVESYCGDILTFIKKTINLGGYVYGVFDEAKILCDSGADYKFPHELFIYGYDDEEQQFYVGDFTFGEHYSYSKVSYSDVRNGYDTITAQEDHIFKDDYKDAEKTNFVTSVYAKLGKLHAEYPELSSGEFKELSLTTQGYAYARVKDGEAIVAVMNNGDTPVQMEFQLPVEASGYEDLMEDTVGGQKLLAEVGWGRMKVQVPSNYATLLRLKH